MKKFSAFLMGLLLLFSLVSCGNKQSEEPQANIPPGFSVIQNQLRLDKHSKKGESASFSQEEFEKLLGEGVSCITLTSLPENGTLICGGTAVLKGQTIPAGQLGYLKFIPNSDCESASFIFTCDSESFTQKTLYCQMVFGDEANLPPVAADSTLETVEGIPCKAELDITEPNGDSFTVNVITYPTKGELTLLENGNVLYIPKDGFHGKDSMVYNVTDRFGETTANATLYIEVEENQSGIRFADMQDNDAYLYAHKMCSENIMVYRAQEGNYYFDPEAPVSKSDFLVMLMCVAGLDKNITAVADSIADDDSNLSSGVKGYISAAYEMGLIKLENGRFSPKESITFSEAAYICAKALKLPHAATVSATNQGGDYDAVAAVAAANIFNISNPAATLTKADAAMLLCNVKSYMTENNMGE